MKDYFEKTRHVKISDKSKNTFYENKKIQDIKIEFYEVKRNLIIQHNLPLFRKMVIDTMLKFSGYTIILTGNPKIYHTLL